jgi:hypothetical protein
MALSAKELEELADNLLNAEFSDKRKNKSQVSEYSILSPSQLKRRLSAEIPYSNLSTKQKLNARMKNYEFDEQEGEY